MGKLYNPADYNLIVNPDLPKTNSPFKVWILLILSAILLTILWAFFTPDIRLSRPVIVYSAGHITATAQATNRSEKPVTLSIRIIVGTKDNDSDLGSGRFYPLAQQEVVVTVPIHSTQPVSCTFPLPGGRVPTHAEAHLLTQR